MRCHFTFFRVTSGNNWLVLSWFYKWSSCFAQQHLPGRGWTNVFLLFNDWDVCRSHLFTCGNRYVVVKRNWGLRGFHRPESVVFHLVFWMFSFFLCWFGVLCFGACFLFLQSKDIRLFAFHLFSYNLRIVDRPQDVLMTVRATPDGNTVLCAPSSVSQLGSTA